MSKTTQLAKIRVGAYDFKIIRKGEALHNRYFLLYRDWEEYTSFGRVHHHVLDGKFEIYADAIRTVAYYQDYYNYNLRVPTLEQISV